MYKYRENMPEILKIIMESQLPRVLSDTVNQAFAKTQPQHVTLGQYTISTSGTSGCYPFFFTVTVASEDMSADFGIWQPDRIEGQKFRPLVNQGNFVTTGRKNFHTFSRQIARQQMTEIDRCLRQMWVYI